MGRYSNGSSSFFLGTWNQFMFCSSWLRLAGTTEPKTGSTHMSNEQPFDIRGSKLHHQIMLSACIFKHPMKKRITQIWPHRTPFTLPFPISNHLPPCLRSPCFFSFFFFFNFGCASSCCGRWDSPVVIRGA